MASHLTTAERDAIVAAAIIDLERIFPSIRVARPAPARTYCFTPVPACEGSADEFYSREYLDAEEADNLATEWKEGW